MNKKHTEYTRYNSASSALKHNYTSSIPKQKIKGQGDKYSNTTYISNPSKQTRTQKNSTFIDSPQNRKRTPSQYTKANLKYDEKSIARRRRNLKDVKTKKYEIEDTSFSRKLLLLSQDKCKSNEVIDGEEIIVFSSDAKTAKVPFYITIFIFTMIAMAILFVHTYSVKKEFRDTYIDKVNEYNDLKLERDNLTLEISKINNDEKYKIIAKNKLGMDKPKSYQIVSIPLESVNYSEIIVKDRNNLTNENWYDVVFNLWRKNE